MTEPSGDGGGPASAPVAHCPWCSAPLATGTEPTCPSCGAALREPPESEVPGVTRVDHEAILRSRLPDQRSRGLLGWLSGEYQPEAPVEPQEGIAPPDEAVRREMLRLEIAALEVERQAQEGVAAAELAEAGGAVAPLEAEPADADRAASSGPSEPSGGTSEAAAD